MDFHSLLCEKHHIAIFSIIAPRFLEKRGYAGWTRSSSKYETLSSILKKGILPMKLLRLNCERTTKRSKLVEYGHYLETIEICWVEQNLKHM